MSKKGVQAILIYPVGRAQRFHPSYFGGSLFNPATAIEAADVIQIETSTFGVSYEKSQVDFERFFSLRLRKKRTVYPNIEPSTYNPTRTMANPIATWINTGWVDAHV